MLAFGLADQMYDAKEIVAQVGADAGFNISLPGLNVGKDFGIGVFVDIDIWSDRWGWTIWFPQLAVDLPPHGVDFGCHAGTTCVVDFEPVYNPSTGHIGDTSKEREVADRTLLGGGCQRAKGREGDYLCPVKGMLGLCKTMLSNSAVSSCGALVPTVVDEILKRGHCTGNEGDYACPEDMMGLWNQYLKNQEILSCKTEK